MTDQERFKRLENTLGTLISWLTSTLGYQDTERLLTMLQSESPKEKEQ